MDLKTIYILGRRMMSLRNMIYFNAVVFDTEEEVSLIRSLQRILFSLQDKQLAFEIHDSIASWIDEFNKYKTGIRLTDEDKHAIKNDWIRWDARIEDALTNKPIICLDTENMLNYRWLQKGAKAFFSDKTWNLMSKTAQEDLDDATRCLLCELPTPAVMISLRATEDVLRFYYKSKTKKDAGRNGWDYLLRELLPIDQKANKYNVNTKLIGLLDYIRDQERNYAEHPDKRYDLSEAHGIFLEVRKTIIAMYNDI